MNTSKQYLVVCLACFFLVAMDKVSVAEEKGEKIYPESKEPVVVAPGQLTELERRRLEIQYKDEVRRKDVILSPFAGGAETGANVSRFLPETQTEQEMLYRYFGIASSLYEEGKLEESIEILEYILYVDPRDKYAKNYLKRLQKELKYKERTWKGKAEKTAESFQKERIRILKEDGIAYYRQKQYDMSLLKFSDVLAIDPKDRVAELYMKRLKQYYSKKLQAEEIAYRWEQEKHGEDLSEKEKWDGEDINSRTKWAAKTMLHEKELEELLSEKKADAVLKKAELAVAVEEIVAREKHEEWKAQFYQLGAGDVISVSVRDHPELSGHAQINIQGNAVLPLTNEIVQVVGLNVEEATLSITEAIKKYVDDPKISVSISAYNSQVFYIMDEWGVTPYVITRANFTLRDALFAGDWGANRALGRVQVIKPSRMGMPIIKTVNAYDMIYRGDLSGNVQIEDGDIIYVPMTMASKWTEIISDSLSPVNATMRLRSEWLDMKWNTSGWRNWPRIPRNADEQDEWNHGAGGIETWY